MDTLDAVQLAVVRCSSEDESCPASHLVSDVGVATLRRLLNPLSRTHSDCDVRGWQSERFCEYPQEIVLAVQGGATTIESLVLVSHPTLIASRIELFVSLTDSHSWASIPFQRLGYVAFRPPSETQGIVQELKTVELSRAGVNGPVAQIKLLVHRCHLHAANLFNQVGLVCVVAMRPSSCAIQDSQTTSLADTLRREIARGKLDESEADRELKQAASFPHLPRRSLKAHFASTPNLPKHGAANAIWIAERGEYLTPTTILTRIQVGQETQSRSPTHRNSANHRAWLADEIECKSCIEQLAEFSERETHARTIDERLMCRREIDRVHQELQAIERRVHQRELEMARAAVVEKLANSPVKLTKGHAAFSASFPLKDKWFTWDQWQVREEFLWRVVSAVKSYVGEGTESAREEDQEDQTQLDEALEIAARGLRDSHPHVFIAATELLKCVLIRHPRFQHGTGWKHEIAQLLLDLATKLDDTQAGIRNNAAYTIVKIAELTRARGTFVVHHLLHYAETGKLNLTGPTLHGLIKILTGLLVTFHCCASLDISHKRVLRFMVSNDALVHENAHVREATKQLLVILQNQVDEAAILAYLQKKEVPADVVASLQDLLNCTRTVQCPSSLTHSQASTG